MQTKNDIVKVHADALIAIGLKRNAKKTKGVNLLF